MIFILLGALNYLGMAILTTVVLKALKSPFGEDLDEPFGLGWPVAILCLYGLAFRAVHRWVSMKISKGFGL